MEKFFKTVFVFVQMVNLNKMELVITIQLAKMEQNGMVSNVPEFHAFQEHHLLVDVAVVKLQSTLVQQVLIGTVQDVFM